MGEENASITASKIADSTSVLAMATINSARQQIARNLETKNLLAEGICNRQVIDQAAASTKSADHGTNDAAIGFRHQEQFGVPRYLLFNLRKSIRTAYMDAFFKTPPQRINLLVIRGEMKITNLNG